MNYKFLDVENHQIISKKFCDYIDNHTNIMTEGSPWTDWAMWHNIDIPAIKQYVPELSEYLNSLNLVPSYVVVIYSPPGMTGLMHIDGAEIPGCKLPWRFLWPLRNCEGSYTHFYQVDESKIEHCRLPNGWPYRKILPHDEIKEIDRVELVQPLIFDPNVAHGVSTNSNCKEPRLSLSIGCKNLDPDMFQ